MEDNFFNGNYEQLHQDDEQIKRIKSSTTAKLTPVTIDIENKSGIFKGSGKNPYNVTLDHCNCGDFRRRKLPCKHIYRLAAELDIFKPFDLKKSDKVVVSADNTKDTIVDMTSGEMFESTNKEGALQEIKKLSTKDLKILKTILKRFTVGEKEKYLLVKDSPVEILKTGIIVEVYQPIKEKLSYALKTDLVKLLNGKDKNWKNVIDPKSTKEKLLNYVLEESNINLVESDFNFNVTLLEPNTHLKEAYVSIYRAIFRELNDRDN